MSQYSVIAARYPLPTTSSTITKTPQEQAAAKATTSSSNENSNNTATGETAAAATSSTTNIAQTSDSKTTLPHISTKDGKVDEDVASSKIVINENDKENIVTIEDLGSEDSRNPESDSASELRRRRLQKFLNANTETVD